MNIGSTIYKLRTAKNLSQEELAELLEVSRQSVSKWETDSATPDLDKLVKLCDIFGITLDELVGRDIPKEEPTEQAAGPSPQIIVQQVPARAPFFTFDKIFGCLCLVLAIVLPVLCLFFGDRGRVMSVFVSGSVPLMMISAAYLSSPRDAWLFFGFWIYIWKHGELERMIEFGTSIDSSALKIAWVLIAIVIYIATCIGWGLVCRKPFANWMIPDKWNRGCLVLLGWLVHLICAVPYVLNEVGITSIGNQNMLHLFTLLTCTYMIYFTTGHLIYRKQNK